MTIKENDKFFNIQIYQTIPLNEILNTVKTRHLKEERQKRLDFAISLLDTNDYTEYTFLIDKHHPAGCELHNITHSGIIFILNQKKFENNLPCFITVFIARPNQIFRLYNAFNIKINNYTLQKCLTYEKLGYNNM